jgi:ABC-type transporter Mla subunit MlaD
MKAKANLFTTLVVLPVGLLVAVAVALFGVDLRTAETQTNSFYLELARIGSLHFILVGSPND